MRQFSLNLNVRFSGVSTFLLLLFNISMLQASAFLGPGDFTCTNPTEIGGFVFEDINANGSKDTEEKFIENITVSLFDDQGTPIVSNTNINGEFLFTGLTIGTDYRIEFTLPTGMQESKIGPDSHSATQINTTGTCNNNLGISHIECYCEDNPFIIVPCYVEGTYNGAYSAEAAIAKLLVSADGHDFVGTTKTADYEASLIATHGQVGSVYGIAWQNTQERYYVSAFHKRYVGYGPNGPDAIYQMDMDNNITGVIELDNLLSATNTTGTDVHDFTPAPNGHVYDLGTSDSSFDGVGKIGFGDMTLSADKNTLYVVNLFDKKIYALDVTDGNTANSSIVTSWDAPDATGAARHRPFGLAFHNNKLWIGTVDENSSNAYVHSLDITGTNFKLELTIPLNYSRQPFIGSNANLIDVSSEWRPWATNSNITYMELNNGREIGFPQPILSDMTFTAEGEMILGFRDRFGDQTGGAKFFNTTESTVTWGTSAGDILKACYDAGTDNFTLETGNGGSCAGIGGLPESGPGSDGIEFYHWDIYNFNDNWDPNNDISGAFHWETTQGALLQLKTKPYVITSCMDPFNDYSGGIVKFDNADGGRHGVGTNGADIDTLTGGYTLFETGDFSGTPPPNNGTLSKGNGLGALDAACTALPLEIGNYVWYDANGNGIQDAGEKGIPGISVRLTDANDVVITTTSTDASGKYLFTDPNVPTRIKYNTDYKVKITLTDTQTFQAQIASTTLLNAGSGKNDNHATMIGNIATVEITTGSSGEVMLDVDFGFAPAATIGNTVWLDENANGIFDAGEEGIPNVTVLLRASNNIIVGNTTTDLNGGYIFNNLPIDNYTVEVSAGLPTGLLPTFNEDSGTLLPDHTTNVNTSNGGNEHLTAIFGYNFVSGVHVNNPNGTTTGAIGNRVWNDINGDGVQDAGEAGIPNVIVTLYNDHDLDGIYDNPIGATTTDASGFYIFDNIAPNAYVLKIDDTTLPANVASIPTGDPDKDADNISEPMMVAPGDVVLLGDFGYQPSSGSTISNAVFIDADADGTQDTDEPGIPGITIQLTNNTSEVIATTVTDQNGHYIFGGLPAGTYSVKVTDTRNILNSLVPVSDADGNNDFVSTITVDGTEDNLLQNFGFAPSAHLPNQGIIGNTIFIDTNNDFAISPGEGAEKVAVNLFESDGTTLVATTQTNKNGTYYFGALDPVATYVVAVEVASLPGGNIYYNSVDPDGAAPGASLSISDLNAKGGLDFTKDFGYAANTPYSIDGTIWEDTNADGTLNDSETTRFANTTVVLTNGAGGVIATTTTNATGNYSFQNLSDGTYSVIISDVQETLTGFWHSLGTDSESDPITVVINGADQTDIDFGYYNQGSAVGNRVWNDLNTNGLQDSGETGIANVVVTMMVDYNGDSTPDITVVTTTDAQGFYSFGQLLLDENYGNANLPTYTISAATPTGMETTTLNAGSDDRLDASDPMGTVVMLSKGESEIAPAVNPATELAIASYDFGFKASVLPVELIAFTASTDDCKVTLKWSAASEVNFSHYEIEHSIDGRNFSKIGQMISSGTATSANYIFMDTKADAENYYRLKMVDLDETFEFSNIINLEMDCQKNRNLKIYPNPLVGAQLTVELYTESLNTMLVIADLSGKIMQSFVVDTDFGQNTLQLDTGNLPNGIYFIYDSSNPAAKSAKFIKIK